MNMDTSSLVPLGQIQGEDASETSQLESMFREAAEYIESHHWARPVAEAYMGIGIGGVLAVWLLRFAEKVGDDADEYLWVINGDLPSAYLVIDQARDPVSALEVYCDLMVDWAQAVMEGKDPGEVFPVDAPTDGEHANMLLDRVRFIRERIIPGLGGD